MKPHSLHYIRNLLLPCLLLSIITGVLSALLISLFQFAAGQAVSISHHIYETVRTNPIWLPCMILGAAAVGYVSSRILNYSKNSRGGGIPTSIAAIQGVVNFRGVTSIVLLPFSALLSFLCGLPLGTEGPCVQMGTGVGDRVVRMFGKKKYKGWRRYIMTGGASAGFSLVTGAPISAIIFSMEELHKRFSPLLFSVASISVLSSQITAHILAHFGLRSMGLFHLKALPTLPIALFFLPLILGILCGGCSVWFTKLYHKIDQLIRIKLGKLSVKIKIPLIFVCIALIGFLVSESLGTGHELIEHLFERKYVWHLLIIVFLIRAVAMMVANTAGVTGGIFLPTLAFGAIVGALFAELLIALNLLQNQHYILFVVIGMTAFLGASSRIPITACIFAAEGLNGANNILPIMIAATAAFLIVELSGTKDFTDIVIESKEHAIHKGKKPYDIEVSLTVRENSFVVNKELRDILWPASCAVLSIERAPENKNNLVIDVGDIITVYYRTYDPIVTAEEFEILVGDQSEEIDRIMRIVS